MQKRRKRLLLLMLAAMMLPVSLSGCSHSSTEKTGDMDSSQNAAASAHSDEPSYGGSVTVGIAQDLDSLDPHRSSSAGTSEVLFNIFEGLVKASPDGTVTCAVASDYTISEDLTTYTFTLRNGVKFHNGDAVTIEDVVYSLQRCAGSENNGIPLIAAFSIVSQIYAPDENHVVIELSEPSMEFLYSMTAAIIPNNSGDTIASNPIGTGPFCFVSYSPQESMTMDRFADYWGETAYLDSVTFKIIANTNSLVMGLKGGTLDLVIHLPNTLASEVENEFTVLQDTMKLVQALYINNDVEPFQDVRVRQAMYYAIDVDEIIDFVCNGQGVAVGSSMYPAFSEYFMEELSSTYPHDIEKAKSLLSEAGYPDGFSMTITVPTNYSQHMDTAEVIAEQLKEVGIIATIEPVEWDTWYTEVYLERNFETTVCAIAASDMTAREMLVRYTSDNNKNFINFVNEEYDQVVNAAIVSLDQEEQVSLYKRAEEILNETAASLWIQDRCDLVVMNPELGGFTFYRSYVLDMSKIYYFSES